MRARHQCLRLRRPTLFELVPVGELVPGEVRSPEETAGLTGRGWMGVVAVEDFWVDWFFGEGPWTVLELSLGMACRVRTADIVWGQPAGGRARREVFVELKGGPVTAALLDPAGSFFRHPAEAGYWERVVSDPADAAARAEYAAWLDDHGDPEAWVFREPTPFALGRTRLDWAGAAGRMLCDPPDRRPPLWAFAGTTHPERAVRFPLTNGDPVPPWVAYLLGVTRIRADERHALGRAQDDPGPAGGMAQQDGPGTGPVDPTDYPAVSRAVVEAIAERSGFPAASLDLGHDLDSDLGLDSITYADIWAALCRQFPAARPPAGRLIRDLVNAVFVGTPPDPGAVAQGPFRPTPAHRPPNYDGPDPTERVIAGGLVFGRTYLVDGVDRVPGFRLCQYLGPEPEGGVVMYRFGISDTQVIALPAEGVAARVYAVPGQSGGGGGELLREARRPCRLTVGWDGSVTITDHPGGRFSLDFHPWVVAGFVATRRRKLALACLAVAERAADYPGEAARLGDEGIAAVAAAADGRVPAVDVLRLVEAGVERAAGRLPLRSLLARAICSVWLGDFHGMPLRGGPEGNDWPDVLMRFVTPGREWEVIDALRCVLWDVGPGVAFDPEWRTEAVVARARGIHHDRAFDRLQALADDLEDAGCRDARLLAHCRGGGPHALGCGAVDLVLRGPGEAWPGGEQAVFRSQVPFLTDREAEAVRLAYFLRLGY
jgi:uncharacterized protein (TIGR02996 family)